MSVSHLVKKFLSNSTNISRIFSTCNVCKSVQYIRFKGLHVLTSHKNGVDLASLLGAENG